MGADKAPAVQIAGQGVTGVKGGRGINKTLKRTKLCQFLQNKETCPFGDNCAFAHASHEVQESPDLRKTKLCKAFQQGGCSDENCNYAHGEAELRVTGRLPKKTVCVWFEKGFCSNGEGCRFDHGTIERAQDSDDGSCGSTKDTMSTSGSDSSGRRCSRRTKNREAMDTPSADASSEDEDSPMAASCMEIVNSCMPVFRPPPGLEDVGVHAVSPPPGLTATLPPPSFEDVSPSCQHEAEKDAAPSPGLEGVLPCHQHKTDKDTYRSVLKQKMDELAWNSVLLAKQANEVHQKLQELEEDEPTQAKEEDGKQLRKTLNLAEAASLPTRRTALKRGAPAFTPSFMQGASSGYAPQYAAFPNLSVEPFADYAAYGSACSYGIFQEQAW